jgi:outer membrane protein OmpA-like peptidoglycan-associated protein/opacity protein-like surface antigen
MASKKYLLLAGIVCLLASGGYSQQVGASYDVKDSSVIRQKDMAQHSEFLNGTYNFPAKPRNQWEIGIKAGSFKIGGDMPTRISPGFGLHVRKAFGYIFSMRLEYNYGIGKGMHFRPANNYAKNPAWAGTNGTGATGYSAPRRDQAGNIVASNLSRPGEIIPVFYNYRTKVNDLSLQGLVSLNNIRFHKAKTGFNFYAFAGVGAMTYNVMVNANNNGASYAADFATIAAMSTAYENRKTIMDELKSRMDDSYETPGESQGDRRPTLGDNTMKFAGTVGAGVAFKLSNRINLALEDRQTMVRDDLLDGQRWQEHAWGDAVLTRDFDSYNFLSLGLNINLGGKSVEPLWWLNPLDYAYSEIRNPRLMRLPKPVLPDSDGDGITDQFDQEQTPAGCPVDSHGVTKDTDGDGVPDCKDKQLITPTYCQPVDADGVGKCPCDPDCVGQAPPDVKSCVTMIGSLPSLAFRSGSVALDANAKSALATVAARLRNNPGCKIVVSGYCASSKREQQLSWDRVNAVINYMVDSEGMTPDRFIFNYGQEGGDCNTVDMRAANDGEDGPNTVEPPHPNLRKN